MTIKLEAECAATKKWFVIAAFEATLPATDAARLFSKTYGCPHRVTDARWPDEDEIVYIFKNGRMMR